MNLHPKILAALVAALIGAIVVVGNAVVGVYPNNALSQLLALALPVIVGYLKSAESRIDNEAPVAPTTPPVA